MDDKALPDPQSLRVSPTDLTRILSVSTAYNPPEDEHDDAQAEMEPECPTCKGTGYYLLDVPLGNPNFGILHVCNCRVPAREQRMRDMRRKLSNLDSFIGKTFESFDGNAPGVRIAYKTASEYARQPNGWLVLCGNYGCGKTHLAAAIANYAFEENDMQVIFAVVPDLLDHLRRTFAPNSELGYDDHFQAIRDVPLLILDDLGTENTTAWAREKLYQIINHRYNQGSATVITCNPDVFKQSEGRQFDRGPALIDGRVLSRMSDVALVRQIMIDAEDYRRRDPAMRGPGGSQSKQRGRSK